MLAMHKQTKINKILDHACGSGSLLLRAKKQFDAHIIEEGFFGQEVNHTTYNLARMNMFLHNINYDKFNIRLGNTLTDPQFADEKPFDAIVSNPPYSVKWIGSDDPTLINDERFAPAEGTDKPDHWRAESKSRAWGKSEHESPQRRWFGHAVIDTVSVDWRQWRNA
jgi:type I restriction system adenine methylase HsdM